MTTLQIPAFVIQPTLLPVSPGFVLNTIRWLVEFDVLEPTVASDALVEFYLVDITNSVKNTLGSVHITIGEVRDASFSNEINPSRLFKTVSFEDLVYDNPSTSGIWQIEVVVPNDQVRLRTVSQEFLWYTLQLVVDNSDPPALPVRVPPQEVFKFPKFSRTHLGSGPVSIEPPPWSSVTKPSGKDVTVRTEPSGYPMSRQENTSSEYTESFGEAEPGESPEPISSGFESTSETAPETSEPTLSSLSDPPMPDQPCSNA